jgi:hypothetical protein
MPFAGDVRIAPLSPTVARRSQYFEKAIAMVRMELLSTFSEHRPAIRRRHPLPKASAKDATIRDAAPSNVFNFSRDGVYYLLLFFALAPNRVICVVLGDLPKH